MKTKTNRPKNHKFWENFRFEFVLYINEQKKIDSGEDMAIICQRLFDVRNYNEDVINSLELKELMDNITSVTHNKFGTLGIIPNHFKEQSKENLWYKHDKYNYKPYFNNHVKNIFEDEDIFTFEIKVDNKVVAKSQFSGNWFQTNIRYSVNIKDIIPNIIEEIQDYFSRKRYTSMYENTNLKFRSTHDEFHTN